MNFGGFWLFTLIFRMLWMDPNYIPIILAALQRGIPLFEGMFVCCACRWTFQVFSIFNCDHTTVYIVTQKLVFLPLSALQKLCLTFWKVHTFCTSLSKVWCRHTLLVGLPFSVYARIVDWAQHTCS